jgi:hypothetical protein
MQQGWRACGFSVRFLAIHSRREFVLTWTRLHEIASEGGSVIRLTTSQASWRDSLKSLNVDFGHTTERHAFRAHHDLRRRDTTQTVTVTASNSQAAASTVTVISTQIMSTSQGSSNATSVPSRIVAPPPMNVTIPKDLALFPSATPLHFNLSFQKLDQNIDLPVLPPPAPQANISIGCKNCTTSGSLDLTAGTFDIQPNNLLGMGDVIQNGSIWLSMVDGFQAHLDLGANISATGAIDIPLFEVPVQGFTVC